MKSIIKSREQSMESPGKAGGLGRNGASVGNSRRTHRSASASSRSSTSSSDILVASAAPAPSGQPSVYESPLPASPTTMAPEGGIEVEVRLGRILVVKAKDDSARAFFRRLKEDDERFAGKMFRDSEESTRIKDELNDDDADGPNRRGTYSKSYILQHPEVDWVHRGQGRYLPASSHHSRKAYSNRSDR